MARGSQLAQTGATTAQNLSNNLEGQASSISGALLPELQAEVVNPQGFQPATLAKMDTAAQQSAGGSQAGATGQGALLAARTKNPGTAGAAIAQSARAAGENLSKATLATRLANEQLKQNQRQEGVHGLENLTGLNTTAGIGALGQIAPLVNANTGESEASLDWTKFITGAIGAGLGAIPK